MSQTSPFSDFLYANFRWDERKVNASIEFKGTIHYSLNGSIYQLCYRHICFRLYWHRHPISKKIAAWEQDTCPNFYWEIWVCTKVCFFAKGVFSHCLPLPTFLHWKLIWNRGQKPRVTWPTPEDRFSGRVCKKKGLTWPDCVIKLATSKNTMLRNQYWLDWWIYSFVWPLNVQQPLDLFIWMRAP